MIQIRPVPERSITRFPLCAFCNDNLILDVQHVEVTEPPKMEQDINNIRGVVTAGIEMMQLKHLAEN